MICTKVFLVFACMVIARAQNICVQVRFVTGTLTNEKHRLDPVELQPNIADWTITVPPQPACPNGVVGLEVIGCDDVIGSVSFKSVYEFAVHRKGSLQEKAIIHIIVNC